MEGALRQQWSSKDWKSLCLGLVISSFSAALNIVSVASEMMLCFFYQSGGNSPKERWWWFGPGWEQVRWWEMVRSWFYIEDRVNRNRGDIVCELCERKGVLVWATGRLSRQSRFRGDDPALRFPDSKLTMLTSYPNGEIKIQWDVHSCSSGERSGLKVQIWESST